MKCDDDKSSYIPWWSACFSLHHLSW